WAGRHMDRERRDPGLLARPTFHDPCTDGAATILGGQFVEITGDAGGDLTALVPGEVVCLVSLRGEPRVQLLQGDRLKVASPPRDLEERAVAELDCVIAHEGLGHRYSPVDSKPACSNFKALLFSETIRTCRSSNPFGALAAISTRTVSSTPGTADRCWSTSSTTFLKSSA